MHYATLCPFGSEDTGALTLLLVKEHVASKAPTNSHSIGGEAGEAIMHNYCPSVTKKLIEMHHEV